MNAAKGKDPKEQCTRFEPQTWRKNRCKNCFKSEAEHKLAEGQTKDGEEKNGKSKPGVKVKKRPPVPFPKEDKSKEDVSDSKKCKADVIKKTGSASPKTSGKKLSLPKTPDRDKKLGLPKTPEKIKKLDLPKTQDGKVKKLDLSKTSKFGGSEKEKGKPLKKVGTKVGALIAGKEDKDLKKSLKDGSQTSKGNEVLSPASKRKQVAKKSEKSAEKTENVVEHNDKDSKDIKVKGSKESKDEKKHVAIKEDKGEKGAEKTDEKDSKDKMAKGSKEGNNEKENTIIKEQNEEKIEKMVEKSQEKESKDNFKMVKGSKEDKEDKEMVVDKTENGQETSMSGSEAPQQTRQDEQKVASDEGQLAGKNKQQQDKNTTPISMPSSAQKDDMQGRVARMDEPKISEVQLVSSAEEKSELEDGKHSNKRHQQEQLSWGKRENNKAEEEHFIKVSPDKDSVQPSDEVPTEQVSVIFNDYHLAKSDVHSEQPSGIEAGEGRLVCVESDTQQSQSKPSAYQPQEPHSENTEQAKQGRNLHVQVLPPDTDLSREVYSGPQPTAQAETQVVVCPLNGEGTKHTVSAAQQNYPEQTYQNQNLIVQDELETSFTGSEPSWQNASSPIGEEFDFSSISQSQVGQHQRQNDNRSDANGINRNFYLIRRHRPAERECSTEQQRAELRARWRAMEDFEHNVSREEAMIEGSRYLIDNLKEKISLIEEKCDRLDREKAALSDLLAVRKAEFSDNEDSYRNKAKDLEDTLRRFEAENLRLSDRLKLPESERANIHDQEKEILALKRKVEDSEMIAFEKEELTHSLRDEINDLHLEMEEIHDQFREEETLEFREIQKELEATAKNCRILQFKLRKAERRNEQVESDRAQYEHKIRQLESRFESDEKSHIRELEEELRMAKEVSVRLHDELEMVEENRVKSDEEVERIQDYLRESENRRVALQTEVEMFHKEVTYYIII